MPSGAEMSGTEMQRRKLHVAFFAAYAGAMAAGLLFRGAYPYALLFGGMCAALLWLAWRHVASPSRGRLVAECLFLAVAMNASYQAMAGAVPIVRGTRLDALLYGIDVAVWGTSPNVWAERFASPWLTEVLSVCYIFFMPLLFGSLLRYFFWRRELLGEFYAGLFTVYGLGFLGYLLVPAMGPYLAYPELFSVTLEGGPITQLNTLMVVEGSNKVDVFPSLHCAVSTFILVFAWRHHRREFWLLLAPVVGLWLSTIYLRYHYLVDVACGFALAAFAARVAARFAENTNKGEVGVHASGFQR
jgi:membrane-associated phospholipid phosphatase